MSIAATLCPEKPCLTFNALESAVGLGCQLPSSPRLGVLLCLREEGAPNSQALDGPKKGSPKQSTLKTPSFQRAEGDKVWEDIVPSKHEAEHPRRNVPKSRTLTLGNASHQVQFCSFPSILSIQNRATNSSLHQDDQEIHLTSPILN